MEWTYLGEKVTDEMTEGYVGFVYEITNLATGRKYLGKKRLQKRQSRPPLKGKKRKRVTITSSDWRDYFGSNEAIQKDVAELGAQNFQRVILRFCKTLAECSYFEAKYLFQTDCILDKNYYNDWLSVRVRRAHMRGLINEREN